MAAEIRVDRITSRTGINTISLTGDGFSYLTNLGVGTTQPTSKLHVVGDTLVTGVSTFTGDSTFSGNVTIGGTITYQDVKHIDAVGIITAQQGIQVLANGLNITGVSTFNGDLIVGVSTFFVDVSNGGVGVGTDNPNPQGFGPQFKVFGVNPVITLEDDGAGADGFSILRQNNNSLEIVTGDANDNLIKIQKTSDTASTWGGSNTTDVVTIDQNAITVGIGTATVRDSAKLDVDGGARFNGDVNFAGSTGSASTVFFDKSDNSLKFVDSAKAKFGDGGDLEIYHDGSNSYIDDTGTGTLNLRGNDFVIIARPDGSTTAATFDTNGPVGLRYNNSTKFETTATGVVITGICTATSFSGDGSLLTGIAAGGSGEFNTGITSTVKFTPLGYESTMFTFPTTSGYQYVVDSINVANVSDTVGIGTSINIIVSIANTNGTSERTHIAYNIPIVDGGLVELLKNPFVASPGDVIRAWTTRGSDYVGLSSCANIYMNYTGTADSTDYVTGFASTIGIQTGQVNTGLYTSFTYPSNLQSIRLTNRTDDGDYPVSVSIKTGATTSYLVKDLIIPRYASVDILARQKRIEINDIVQVSVGATSTIDIILAGKKITS